MTINYRMENSERTLALTIDMRVTRYDSAIFVTTFVLYSIARIDHPCVTTMRKKAISFLTEEMVSPGLFQYYTSKNI